MPQKLCNCRWACIQASVVHARRVTVMPCMLCQALPAVLCDCMVRCLATLKQMYGVLQCPITSQPLCNLLPCLQLTPTANFDHSLPFLVISAQNFADVVFFPSC